MGIYSKECEICKEETKRKKMNKTGAKIHKYMYECNNSKCKIQRTVKKELSKYNQMNLCAGREKDYHKMKGHC